MIRRIVKMTFQPDKVEVFKNTYRKNWKGIRNFDGCALLELLQDEFNPAIFFTYSHWESEEHLQRYRKSDVFATVWSATKMHFSERPEAWTVNLLDFDNQ